MTATVDDGPPFLARIHRYAEDVLRPAALVQGQSADVRDAQLRHFHALATASGAHDRTAR